jgi:hypothetical protein
MIKNIHTLIKDIYDVVESEEGWLTASNVEGLTGKLGRQLVQSSGQKDSGAVLRLSQMGEKCPCQLWHSVRTPSLGEKFTAPTLIKFTYGHVIEALVIGMAKAADHEVTGEQDVLYLDGVKGHRDCVIDGCVVDVKSTNSLSFQKIKSGAVAEDPFLANYLAQLDGYVVASADDPVVRVKDRGYLLAVDKTLGHMCLYEHRVTRTDDGSFQITERIKRYKDIIGRDSPPDCTCETVKDGESGNIKLGVVASYNPYKHLCAGQRKEHLRTFLYEGGPRFLTRVSRRPKRRDGTLIPEVDRDGKLVYN